MADLTFFPSRNVIPVKRRTRLNHIHHVPFMSISRISSDASKSDSTPSSSSFISPAQWIDDVCLRILFIIHAYAQRISFADSIGTPKKTPRDEGEQREDSRGSDSAVALVLHFALEETRCQAEDAAAAATSHGRLHRHRHLIPVSPAHITSAPP